MILILTPLSIEQKYLLKALETRGITLQKKTHPAHFSCDQHNLSLAIGGHGKTQFGIQTQYWISQLGPVSKIFTVGAAGALSKNINILDLVVVNKIIEHDYQMLFSPKNKKPEFYPSPLIINKNSKKNYEVHQGPLASGDEDIIEVKRAEELYESTQALAVAWESAGGIRAAQFNNIPYFEIRGITDNARKNVASDFKKNIELTMDNIADFITPYIKAN